MYQRYLILILLFALVIPLPTNSATVSSVPSNITVHQPLIEARLQMEIANSQDKRASAILEFESPLSNAEILRAEALGLQFSRRGSTIINVGRIYSATVNSPDVLTQLSSLGLLRATSGTKQYIPSLISSVPTIRADEVWNNLHVEGQTINGSGVIVAVIDTGVMWTHPSFWRQSPGEFDFIQSGPDYFIDLNNDAIADLNEGPIETVGAQSGSMITYASDYMYINVDGSYGFNYAAGDRWIGGIDANHDNSIDLTSEKGVIFNISKVAMFYDQYESKVYVRGVNLTLAPSVGDTNNLGHGTHVASTIAGGQPGFTSYVGVAPGADLIVVRSPLNSEDIIDGISFAIENDADIINMSFSSYLGFLDGTDLEDLAVTEAFLSYGILSTAAAGNLAGNDKHARFNVASGSYNEVSLDVHDETTITDFPYLSLLWQSDDRDEHVILSQASTEPIDLGKYSDLAGQSFFLNTENLTAYVFCEISLRGMNNIIIQVSTEEHDWLDGHWTVRVENPQGAAINVDAYAWDGDWGTSYMKFSDHIEDMHTISAPATADFAIAVGSHNDGFIIADSSSRGPRIDGWPKPDISAPGVSIYAARNDLNAPYFTSAPELWIPKSGTSMASPHIAGTLALIRQADVTSNGWKDYSALMNGAGGWSSHYSTSSSSYGHGYGDAVLSVMHVLNETLRTNSTQSDWTFIDNLQSDAVDPSVSADLDIVSLKVMQQIGTLGFAVTTVSQGDFSGTDMLSIEWDTDSNVSTGINGANILLNLTGNVLSVYDWNGSSYIPSLLLGSWWQEGAMSVLKIEGLGDAARGTVICATHNSTGTYLDQTSPASLVDQWRPLILDLVISQIDSSLSVELTTGDRDSSQDMRTIGSSVVDGQFRILQSSVVSGQESIEFLVESDALLTLYANSLLFNVTSESEILFSPPIILSGSAGGFMRFVGASLSSSIIRVGLLYNDRISGEFTLEGYFLASEVLVGFHHSTGLWFNFTLTGTEGFYEFLIAPDGFPMGGYDVYAIAKSATLPTAQLNFSSLTIVDDSTVVFLGLGLIVAAFVVILMLKRFGKRRGLES
ncbi:MAG: S8 family serine peptidase [Candidatus Thorarchaeota archaeon]